MAAGQGVRGGGWQKESKRGTRCLSKGGGACLVDSICDGTDPAGVGEGGCWLSGAGGEGACGVEARAKAFADVHKYPA